MARPEKNTVDYFPHNCVHGKTMYIIENKFGNNGYAFWFKLLETLGKSENHYIDCRINENWEYLLAKTKSEEEFSLKILDTLSKLGSIDQDLWSLKIIYSENFVLNLTRLYERRKKLLYTKTELLHTITQSDNNLCIQKHDVKELLCSETPQSIVKYSIEENSKEKLISEKLNDEEKISCFPFDQFWDMYGKKVGLQKCTDLYKKISESDREKIKVSLPAYVQAKEKQFRKDPERYLKNKTWLDEVVTFSMNNVVKTQYRADRELKTQCIEEGFDLARDLKENFGI